MGGVSGLPKMYVLALKNNVLRGGGSLVKKRFLKLTNFFTHSLEKETTVSQVLQCPGKNAALKFLYCQVLIKVDHLEG